MEQPLVLEKGTKKMRSSFMQTSRSQILTRRGLSGAHHPPRGHAPIRRPRALEAASAEPRSETANSWSKAACRNAPTFLLNLIGIVRDLVLIVLVFIEGSFTNSAGRHYAFGDSEGVGGFIFVWLCANVGLSALRNVFSCCFSSLLGEFDMTSFLLYLFSLVAVAQYAHFIDLDYKELGNGDDKGFWATLNSIRTLGNEPQQPVDAEAISWALVELFVYTLVVLDLVWCVRCLTEPVRVYLRRPTACNARLMRVFSA